MAGSIKLSDFKAKVTDVARPNRLWVQITSEKSVAKNFTDDMSFLAKSVSLPNRTIGNIEVNWQGMKAKIAGDPTFDDMTLTFLNDYEWKIKKYFEAWIEEVATMVSNDRTAHGTYKSEVKIEQLGRTGEVLATYKLLGAYSISMDAIELNQESGDTVEELSVSLAYDYFEVL